MKDLLFNEGIMATNRNSLFRTNKNSKSGQKLIILPFVYKKERYGMQRMQHKY